MTESWWRAAADVWHSGPWSLEMRGDELAEIRHDGRLLVRGARAAVRDHGWRTVPAEVVATAVTADSLTLRLRHDDLGAHLTSVLSVAAEGPELRIVWDAENHVPFQTCRTGLVVLHPAADAGAAVTVTHSDGSAERTSFPREVRPHQPITDIRMLRIEQDGATFALHFDGDVFEMEDQRNWTDASFKTYSRPLSLPFPYALTRGEHVRQSITIRIHGETSSPAPHLDPVLTLAEAALFPEIGVEASTAADPGPLSRDGSFRVVELTLATPNWRAALHRAAADGLPLDVRLVTDRSAAPLAAACIALAAFDVARVTAVDAVLHVSDVETIGAARKALAHARISPEVIGGTRSHFTEFNREHGRLPDDLDGIAFTTTPLFHTVDTEQLIEALPMQRLIATQAVTMAGGLPVHIGPVALRPRFNNVATTPEPVPVRDDLREGYGAQLTGADDARQTARELAGWTIASAAALAVPGVRSLSWFETWGPRGLRARDGEPAPAAEAIAALVALGGRTLLWATSPDGLVWAIGGRSADDDIILASNVASVPRTLRIAIPDGEEIHEIHLDAGAWTRVIRPR